MKPMHRRFRFASAAALAAVLLTIPATATVAAGPRETMQKTVDEVLAILKDPSLSHEERLQAIEKIAYARFDMSKMSKLVLRKNWKRFSDEQKAEYISEFKKYLANNYGSRIQRYDQQEVEILGVRDEPRGHVTVRTRIVGGEFDNAMVDYRMYEKDGEWRVIDVVIEGVSMVSNFHDQFQEVVSRGGPEHLLEKLREKNAQPPADE